MKDPNKVFAANLREIMLHRDMVNTDGEPSQSELARLADIGQRSVGRVLHCENSATLDMVWKISKVLNLEAWQLLSPDFDAKNPPVATLTKSERDFYDQLKTSFAHLVKQV